MKTKTIILFPRLCKKKEDKKILNQLKVKNIITIHKQYTNK